MDNEKSESNVTVENLNIGEEQKKVKKNKTVPLTKVIMYLAASVILTAAITTVISYLILNGGSEISKTVSKLRKVDSLVKNEYAGDIDYSVIDNAVLKAYVDSLDDNYSFYKSAASSKDVSDSFSGKAGGIGVSVIYDSDAKNIYVCSVYEGAPAEKAGIKVGDRIVTVDGIAVEENGYKKSVSLIKKSDGQKTVLNVLRDNKSVTATVICGEFTEQSVFYNMIDKKAYIKITGFNSSTVGQFNKAISFAKLQKADGIIFDVRNNGGGTVDSAAKIIDSLVGECDIVTVQYSKGENQVLYKSDNQKLDLPMAVITNGDTASSAELFTAALRDEAKAKLIGEKTFGKGVMQETYFLSDKSSVRFTVAEFYPPCGVCFDGIGISPDVKVSFAEQQKKVYYTLEGKNDPFILAAYNALEDNADE